MIVFSHLVRNWKVGWAENFGGKKHHRKIQDFLKKILIYCDYYYLVTEVTEREIYRHSPYLKKIAKLVL